jgi:hypothetical protein
MARKNFWLKKIYVILEFSEKVWLGIMCRSYSGEQWYGQPRNEFLTFYPQVIHRGHQRRSAPASPHDRAPHRINQRRRSAAPRPGQDPATPRRRIATRPGPRVHRARVHRAPASPGPRATRPPGHQPPWPRPHRAPASPGPDRARVPATRPPLAPGAPHPCHQARPRPI